MKAIVSTFIFTLCFSCFLKGQEYQCVYPDKKVYFEDENKSVYCIRIDSAFNNNAILYPFSDLHKIDEGCYSITSGSWLSKYIVLDKNGNTFFVNGKNQFIFIKNQAVLHENWEAFANDDIKVKGEITSITLKPVLGVEDSVKTISFSVYNSDNEPVNHALNQLSLEVSKQFGLVKTVSFYHFESVTDDYFHSFRQFTLIGINNPQRGFQNINLREQYYDFQVGDEFHIWDLNRPSTPSSSSERKIIHRYISRTDYADSIVYSYERKIYSEIKTFVNGSVNTDISTVIDTLKQKIVKGLLFDTEPNEPYGGDWGVSTVRIVNVPITKMYIFDYNLYYDDDCLRPVTANVCNTPPTYYTGLGGPYYAYCEMWNNAYAYDLVYYKKGDTEVGIPFDFTMSVPEYKTDASFVFYPNPASNYITIKSTGNEISGNSVIEIYDIYGRKCLEKLLDTSGFIDVSFLQPGCYIVKLMRENQTMVCVKMIKQ